jgi:chorismate-pyruvate lyase
LLFRIAEIEQFMASLSSIKFRRPAWIKSIMAAAQGPAKLTLAVCAMLPIGGAALADAAPPRAWPDSYQARLEVLALLETLNADLLASHSATATLTEWCTTHHMAQEPKIVARLQNGIMKPISSAQRQELDIGPDEPVVYRRVELACGDHILSQADNWYVPSRLTPAMNAVLQSSDVPFGSVISPLHPRRQTIAVRIFWQPLPPGWEMQPPMAEHPVQKLVIPPLLFEHRAVVYGAAGSPISEVDESYRAEILDFLRQK